jgi:RecA-family ATPase
LLQDEAFGKYQGEFMLKSYTAVSFGANDDIESSSFKEKNPNNILDEYISFGSKGYDTPTDWLVQRIIPANSVGFIIGESQSFKSFITVALGASIAKSEPFGDLKVSRPKLVFYVAAEGGTAIARRLKAWENKFGDVGENFITIKRNLNLASEQGFDNLTKIIRSACNKYELEAGLVIIDTFSQCSDLRDENSAAEVSKYIAACTRFSQEHKVTVLNVHHVNKKGGIRGSSTIVSNSDFVLNVNRVKNDFSSIVTIEKMKDADSSSSLHLTLSKEDLNFTDEFDDKVCTLVVDEIQLSSSKNELPTPLKNNSQSWLLHKLNESDDKSMLRDELTKMYINEFDIGSDQAIKIISRALKPLQNKGEIESVKQGRTYRLSLSKQ